MYKRIYSIFIMMFLSFQAFSAENAQQNAQDSGQNNSVTSDKSNKNAAGLMAGAGAIGAGAVGLGIGLGYNLGEKSAENKVKLHKRAKLVNEVNAVISKEKAYSTSYNPYLDMYADDMKKLVRAGSEKKFIEEDTKIKSDPDKAIAYKKYIHSHIHKKIGKIIERSAAHWE